MDTLACGAVYVAYGAAAKRECSYSIASLAVSNPGLRATVISDGPVEGANLVQLALPRERNRWAKLNADNLSPYELTVYLDADTRVNGYIGAGFGMVQDGWDLAIAPSTAQVEWLWHCGPEDCALTEEFTGHRGLVLGAGVFFFTKGKRVRDFFTAWRGEWLRHPDQDQAAMLRALQRVPLKVWLLGRDWNGGAIIAHRYGMARR